MAHSEIRESTREADVEAIPGRAREESPEAEARVILDTGRQFAAKSLQDHIPVCGMTHARTSPFYPQRNGKIERWHKSLKTGCIPPRTPPSLEEARRIVDQSVGYHHSEPPQGAMGSVTPKDKLAEARERRARQRQQADLKAAQMRRLVPPGATGRVRRSALFA